MVNVAGSYALIACALFGATLVYAIVLVFAALLVRETRDLYKSLTDDGPNSKNPPGA
jgi:hypothetical protein